jgi:hypothetical protein
MPRRSTFSIRREQFPGRNAMPELKHLPTDLESRIGTLFPVVSGQNAPNVAFMLHLHCDPRTGMIEEI